MANIIEKEHLTGNEIIAVVSAMSGKTNELVKQSNLISKNFNKGVRCSFIFRRTSDSILLAGALIGKIKAKSFMNWQIPILTEGEHSNSRIININVKDK